MSARRLEQLGGPDPRPAAEIEAENARLAEEARLQAEALKNQANPLPHEGGSSGAKVEDDPVRLKEMDDIEEAIGRKDYYAVLGVDRDAMADVITRAYRKLSKKYHPDTNPGDARAAAIFNIIGEAKENLDNPANSLKEYGRGMIKDVISRFGEYLHLINVSGGPEEIKRLLKEVIEKYHNKEQDLSTQKIVAEQDVDALRKEITKDLQEITERLRQFRQGAGGPPRPETSPSPEMQEFADNLAKVKTPEELIAVLGQQEFIYNDKGKGYSTKESIENFNSLLGEIDRHVGQGWNLQEVLDYVSSNIWIDHFTRAFDLRKKVIEVLTLHVESLFSQSGAQAGARNEAGAPSKSEASLSPEDQQFAETIVIATTPEELIAALRQRGEIMDGEGKKYSTKRLRDAIDATVSVLEAEMKGGSNMDDLLAYISPEYLADFPEVYDLRNRVGEVLRSYVRSLFPGASAENGANAGTPPPGGGSSERLNEQDQSVSEELRAFTSAFRLSYASLLDRYKALEPYPGQDSDVVTIEALIDNLEKLESGEDALPDGISLKEYIDEEQRVYNERFQLCQERERLQSESGVKEPEPDPGDADKPKKNKRPAEDPRSRLEREKNFYSEYSPLENAKLGEDALEAHKYQNKDRGSRIYKNKQEYIKAKSKVEIKKAREQEWKNIVKSRWEALNDYERAQYGGLFKDEVSEKFEQELIRINNAEWARLEDMFPDEEENFVTMDMVHGLMKEGYLLEDIKKSLFGPLDWRGVVRLSDTVAFRTMDDFKQFLLEVDEREKKAVNDEAIRRINENYEAGKKRFREGGGRKELINEKKRLLDDSVTEWLRGGNIHSFPELYQFLNDRREIKGSDGKHYRADAIIGRLKDCERKVLAGSDPAKWRSRMEAAIAIFDKDLYGDEGERRWNRDLINTFEGLLKQEIQGREAALGLTGEKELVDKADKKDANSGEAKKKVKTPEKSEPTNFTELDKALSEELAEFKDQNPGIDGEFDMSAQGRRAYGRGKEARDLFDENFAKHQEALVLCHSFIEREIEMVPDVPADEGAREAWKESLMRWVNDIGNEYGFTAKEKAEFEKRIDDYMNRQERVVEVLKQYEGKNKELIEYLWGKDIASLGITDEDLAGLTISRDRMAIVIQAMDQDKLKKLRANDATDTPYGFYVNRKDVDIVVFNAEKFSPQIKEHEIQHVKNNLIAEMFRGDDRKNAKEQYETVLGSGSKKEKEKALKGYLEAVKGYALGKFKNEFIASLHDVGFEKLSANWRKIFLENKTSSYQYLKEIEELEGYEKIKEGYVKIIDRAIGAYARLIDPGVGGYDMEKAINFFTYIPLDSWEAKVDRMLEGREKRGKEKTQGLIPMGVEVSGENEEDIPVGEEVPLGQEKFEEESNEGAIREAKIAGLTKEVSDFNKTMEEKYRSLSNALSEAILKLPERDREREKKAIEKIDSMIEQYANADPRVVLDDNREKKWGEDVWKYKMGEREKLQRLIVDYDSLLASVDRERDVDLEIGTAATFPELLTVLENLPEERKGEYVKDIRVIRQDIVNNKIRLKELIDEKNMEGLKEYQFIKSPVDIVRRIDHIWLRDKHEELIRKVEAATKKSVKILKNEKFNFTSENIAARLDVLRDDLDKLFGQ